MERVSVRARTMDDGIVRALRCKSAAAAAAAAAARVSNDNSDDDARTSHGATTN